MLTRPGVAAVMSGAHTVDELKKCLEYTTAADIEKDYAAVFAALPKISWKGTACIAGIVLPVRRE